MDYEFLGLENNELSKTIDETINDMESGVESLQNKIKKTIKESDKNFNNSDFFKSLLNEYKMSMLEIVYNFIDGKPEEILKTPNVENNGNIKDDDHKQTKRKFSKLFYLASTIIIILAICLFIRMVKK